MDSKLSKYTKKNYPDSKSDMFAVFIEKCNSLTDKNGFCSMITMPSWLFLSSFENLRKYIINNLNIKSLLHMGRGIFGIDFGSVAFTLKKEINPSNTKGNYYRLHKRNFQHIYYNDIKKIFLNSKENTSYKYNFDLYRDNQGVNEISNLSMEEGEQIKFQVNQKNFEKIPGIPVGYWASDKVIKIFEKNQKLGDIFESGGRIKTHNDEKYLRFFWEIEDKDFNNRYFFCNKGGEFRKWYGNLEYIIDWSEEAKKEYKSHGGMYNLKFEDKIGITWGNITSSIPSYRIKTKNSKYNSAAPTIFNLNENTELTYLLAFLNTKFSIFCNKLINPTLSNPVGEIFKLPIIISKSLEIKEKIDSLVEENIDISKEEWDSRETSWDFEKLSLIDGKDLKSAFENYCSHWRDNFVQLHKNEEELNRLFIEIYELQDEMDEKIEFKDITILKEEAIIIQIDKNISKEFLTESEKYLYDRGVSLEFNKNVLIKQFISYAVGCMFGRYSLDEEGLVFAGGEFDKNKYSKFIPDEDNCIPITDSEYFSDDIVTRFVEFVKIVYGEETLEENLKFIAQALSNKNDAPKEIIREYFLKNFYEDHLKRYKKRPIYWLYDAGKKNGFKALIYMHRYNEQTTAKVRIGYLHELQKHYERRASFLKDEIESNNNRKKAEQELKKIKSQLDECKQFDEKMNHLSSEYISIDLDDGVKVNYEKVQTGRDGKKYEILGKVK